MITDITHVTRVVSDHDEALSFYTGTLGMEKRQDRPLQPGFRFVTVPPPGETTEILLSIPQRRQEQRIGTSPILTLLSDDTFADAERSQDLGVESTQGPDDGPWGVLAVFVDPDGNPYELLER